MTTPMTASRHQSAVVSTPVPRWRGSPLHHVGILGIDAERERRRPVGDQVDPQELGGEQRQEQPGIGRHEAEQAANITPANMVSSSPAFDDSR